MLTLKRKVTRTGRSLEVVVPREIVEYPKIRLGDYVEFAIEDTKVMLAKAK